MDKIDSKDQLFSNLKNNKLKWHIFAVIVLLIMNNIKQFDFLSLTNFFKGNPESTPNNDNEIITNAPEFLNNKSAVVSVIAAIFLLYYIRLMGKTISSYILKNELWNNDTGIYSILNIPITVTSFLIITISIMMILRLLHFHVGGVYLEKNTYLNKNYNINLEEGDKINTNQNNLKILNIDAYREIPISSNIIPTVTDYEVDRFQSIKYRVNNKIIWKLRDVFDSSDIRKMKFIGDKILLINSSNEEIDQILLNEYLNDTNDLYFYLAGNGNLMLLKGQIDSDNEYIISNIIDAKNNKVKILWQSGADIKPNEEINHILTASNNVKRLNFNNNEDEENFILKSKNGTYTLLGYNNNGKRKIYVKKSNDKIIWSKDIQNISNETDNISINENMNLVFSSGSSVIPDKVKFLELKNDGNLVAYNVKEEAVWMSRKGLFNGKGFLSITLPYLIYAGIFYLVESMLVNQKWYIGFIRKFIRVIYLVGGFLAFSFSNGLSINNFVQFVYLFFFLLYFIFWKTKDFVKDSNNKKIVYFSSFFMFSMIYLIFNLVRKISIFPIYLSEWSHNVDDIECNTNLLEIFTNPTFRHQPSRYIFFVLAILLFLPLLLFAVNKPSLFQDKGGNIKNFLGYFFINKSFTMIFGLWFLFNVLFAIVPNINAKRNTFEGNLIYANYHKIIGFTSIIVGFMYLLFKTFTNSDRENNYYNVLLFLVTLFIINKFIEYPSISFYFDQKKSNDKYYHLSPNSQAKNNFIRILVLFIAFLFISYNIFTDPNSNLKSKSSVIFMLFTGFFTTILGLVYQHLFYEGKEPEIEQTNDSKIINFINWKDSDNKICGNSDNFRCKKISNKLLNLRDYSIRLPLLISIIGLIVYFIFKNNENVYYINFVFIMVLFSFIGGINFAESGKLFDVNIFGVNQDYDIVSSPLFSFFISFANDGYVKGGIATTVILLLSAIYYTLKSNTTDKTKSLIKNIFIVILLSLFIAPIITSSVLTFQNDKLKGNEQLFESSKKILNNKINNTNIDGVKIFSFVVPVLMTVLSFLVLIYRSFKVDSFIFDKSVTFIVIGLIIFVSFIYGRFVGLMNTSPSDINTDLKNQIKNTRQIEQNLEMDYNIINKLKNNDNISIWSTNNYDISSVKTFENDGNINNFFYIYFHGIDVINNLIIKDMKNYIPPIYKVSIGNTLRLDTNIDNTNKLYKEINKALQKMRKWYLDNHDIDINIKFINSNNDQGNTRSNFYLYNYEIKSVTVNDNDKAGIVIKNGIKYKGKYLNEVDGLKNYKNAAIKLNQLNSSIFTINNDTLGDLDNNNYLNLNYDLFSVIFDGNVDIIDKVGITDDNSYNFGISNNNSGLKDYNKVLASETLEKIYESKINIIGNGITDCNSNYEDNQANRKWRHIYEYYYFNTKYGNGSKNKKYYDKPSNLKNLLGFDNVEDSSNSQSKYKGYSLGLVDGSRDSQRETHVNQVNAQRDFNDIIGDTAKLTQCNETQQGFTDYNYNFKL